GLRTTPNRLADRVLRWLASNDRWLLVFDNANSLDELEEFLPHGPGHVLITSRDQDWRQKAAVVDVDVFPPEDSIEFLGKRSGHANTGNMDGSAAVAEMLGHLPLALEQAAAFMAETGTPFLEYVRLFERRASELLDMKAPQHLRYPATVATTWNLLFERIGSERPAAAQLLQLCAFMAPDAIPGAI